MKIKKLATTFAALVISASSLSANSVLAAESIPENNQFENHVNDENNQVSKLFVDFIDEAFNEADTISVTNIDGNDVTSTFTNVFSDLHANGDYKGIQEIIIDQHLSLAKQQNTLIPETNKSNLKTPNGVRSETTSKAFYRIATESKGKFRKEWVVTLRSNFSYDDRTYRITNASSPTITLTTAHFGASFTPALEDISTSSSFLGQTATFNASYRMRAVLGISAGDLPLGFNLNFGNFTETFSAMPSALQY